MWFAASVNQARLDICARMRYPTIDNAVMDGVSYSG